MACQLRASPPPDLPLSSSINPPDPATQLECLEWPPTGSSERGGGVAAWDSFTLSLSARGRCG